MKITKEFKEQVQKAWGNPYDVGVVTMEELFSCVGLEFDDRENYALKIGILAGETKGEKPAVFVKLFKKGILAEIEA